MVKKLSERKKLIKKLDELSKEVVRKRDGFECQRCGRHCEGPNRHVSHVFPVSSGHSLRWEPLNMKILCYHCHINWFHKNPMESSEWFANKFPTRMVYLRDHRYEAKKFADYELEAMVIALTQRLKEEV